jgi:hypothetical protein
MPEHNTVLRNITPSIIFWINSKLDGKRRRGQLALFSVTNLCIRGPNCDAIGHLAMGQNRRIGGHRKRHPDSS